MNESVSVTSATSAKAVKASATAFLLRDDLHIFFCFLSGLCCLIPVCLGMESNLESRPLRQSLEDNTLFRYSCVASVAICIPLLIDTIFDLMTLTKKSPGKGGKKNPNDPKTARYNFLNVYERLLILIGVLALPAVGFLPTDTENLALTYVCCCKCQQNWVGGALALSLCRFQRKYWSIRSTYISLYCFQFGLIGAPFVDNAYAYNETPSQEIKALDIANTMFVLIPTVFFFFNCIRWVIVVPFNAPNSLRRILMCSSSASDSDREDSVTRNAQDPTFFPMIFTLCGTTLVVLLLVLILSTSRVENYTHLNLVQNNAPFILFVIWISTLSMRLVKFEVVQGLYALIDSKKAYVRYISHELRTPLNSAFLGLKLLTDDLSNSTNPKDADRREILSDVNVACRTTVDILNDLLCFDKMESGILILHKHEVPALPFINDCVGMFSAQAREGGVTISVVNGDGGLRKLESGKSTEEATSSLLDTDTIHMDRFKMDQVLRNLISNALKFTPRGGSVTVTVTFVPTVHTVFDITLSSRPESQFSHKTRRESFGISNLLRKPQNQVHAETDIETGDCQKSVDTDVPSPVPTNVKGNLVVVVKDTGAGMIEDDYQRLFTEIVQFNPEVLQAGGGSGLGLWITKGIVDLHKGKVGVHSDGLGTGSSFTVELPMVRNFVKAPLPKYLEVSRRLSMSMRQAISPNVTKKEDFSVRVVNKRAVYDLLIVDDSALNRKMLLRILRTAGHVCDEAEDGLQAIIKVKEKMASSRSTYSAILMDFVMPNMDGPTATKEIRALGYTAPIFGVTGNALDTDIDYFIQSGANKVLAKPLEMKIFQEAMEA